MQTKSLTTQPDSLTVPSAAEAAQARALGARLDGQTPVRLTLDGETLDLPPFALEVLRRSLAVLGQGDAVTVVSVHQELTTQEAADVLNVSRPYVCKLLDDGVLPSRKVNTHRRVRLADVLAHKAQQAAVAETAMAELQAQAQELDLGY